MDNCTVPVSLSIELLEELQKDADLYTGGDLSKMICARLGLAKLVRPSHGHKKVSIHLKLKDFKSFCSVLTELQSVKHIYIHPTMLDQKSFVIATEIERASLARLLKRHVESKIPKICLTSLVSVMSDLFLRSQRRLTSNSWSPFLLSDFLMNKQQN